MWFFLIFFQNSTYVHTYLLFNSEIFALVETLWAVNITKKLSKMIKFLLFIFSWNCCKCFQRNQQGGFITNQRQVLTLWQKWKLAGEYMLKKDQAKPRWSVKRQFYISPWIILQWVAYVVSLDSWTTPSASSWPPRKWLNYNLHIIITFFSKCTK